MTERPSTWLESASELRRSFDLAFVERPALRPDAFEAALAVCVASKPYALRAGDVAGLFKDWRVIAVPSPAQELLGLAGLYGSLIPVYDLAALLGHARPERLRWVVRAAGRDPIAFAFDAFEGQYRILREPGRTESASDERPRAAVSLGGILRPILDLPSLVSAIRDRARAGESAKER
jgi:chemotaxis signal transduction protein